MYVRLYSHESRFAATPRLHDVRFAMTLSSPMQYSFPSSPFSWTIIDVPRTIFKAEIECQRTFIRDRIV